MLLCVHVFVVCVCCMWSYIHVGANRLPLPLPLPPPSLDAPNFLVGQDTDQHAFAAHRLYCLVKVCYKIFQSIFSLFSVYKFR